MHILIVEDEALIAFGLADVLRDSRHVITGMAATSKAAFEMCQRCDIELAFVDIDLERKGVGLSIARHLHHRQDCSVILTTGRPNVARSCDCAIGVLSKPYVLDEIPSVVDTVERIRRGEITTSIPKSLQLLPALDAHAPDSSPDGVILVVEDHPLDVELTMTALRECHVSNPVVIARDGVEAIEYLESPMNAVPNVMLLDVKMPRMNGHEVLKHLRGTAKCRRLPVVMLTSSNEDADFNRSFEHGADDYIVKPHSFSSFSKALNRLDRYGITRTPSS
jgi:CheY-like chemotaxis protein